ncbi:MAG: hypothetical protein ACI9J5_002263 [Paraglaciecola sp.]
MSAKENSGKVRLAILCEGDWPRPG